MFTDCVCVREFLDPVCSTANDEGSDRYTGVGSSSMGETWKPWKPGDRRDVPRFFTVY